MSVDQSVFMSNGNQDISPLFVSDMFVTFNRKAAMRELLNQSTWLDIHGLYINVERIDKVCNNSCEATDNQFK